MTIDLNADLGEGAGTDERLAQLVTSINVACGAHAGSPESIRAALHLARLHGLAAGAHPGYPDRARFGRVTLRIDPAALHASCVEQVRAVHEAARAEGLALAHVKPHGALYNDAARDLALARLVAEAVRAVDPALALFGPPASALEAAAATFGLRFVREGFADRGYRADGSLVPRSEAGAVLHDPAHAAERAVRIARGEAFEAAGGGTLVLEVDTLCLHGDTAGAVEFARAVRNALSAAGLEIAPIDRR